jgi:hypothetical protein
MSQRSREKLKVRCEVLMFVEEMTNYFKSLCDDGELTGLNLILGSYAIHVIEGENQVVNRILRALDEYS